MLTTTDALLTNFIAMVKHNFRSPGWYPTYSLQMPFKKVAAAILYSLYIPPPVSSTSPIPSFGQCHPSPPKPPPWLDGDSASPSPPTDASPRNTAATRQPGFCLLDARSAYMRLLLSLSYARPTPEWLGPSTARAFTAAGLLDTDKESSAALEAEALLAALSDSQRMTKVLRGEISEFAGVDT